MNLCSDNHDEVCFEGRGCPCCEEIDIRERKISALEDKVQALQDEVDSFDRSDDE